MNATLNVKTVNGVRFHLREDGEIHREYRPGCWDEMAAVDSDVMLAFGISGFKYVVRDSGHLSTVFS